MEHFHEEPDIAGKLYNREIMRILFGYVVKYRRQLLFSLAGVVIITAATLAIPLVARIVIDRHIVKVGYIADRSAGGGGPQLDKCFRAGVALTDNRVFVFQAQLAFFSKTQISAFVGRGIFSNEKYTLIESPQLDVALQRKLEQAVAAGAIRAFGSDYYCAAPGAFRQFTGRELLMLRARDARAILGYALLMIAIFCVQFVVSYLQIIALMKLSQFSMRDLRRDLFAHVLSLEVAFFDRNPIGRLVNRVTNDIEALNEMFSSVLITLFQDILILVGITAVMFTVSVPLACAVAVTFPFLFVLTLLFQIKARKAYRAIRTKIAALNAFLNENISGIRIVQIFVQELKQLARFRLINQGVYQANLNQLYVYAVFRPLIDFFRWFAVGSVIYFGGRLILDDRISWGLVVMFLSYIGSFFEPVGDLSEKFDTMQSATAAGEKILTVFNAQAVKESRDPAGMAAFCNRTGFVSSTGLPRLTGPIEFDDVWFAYNDEEWVLKGVSFSVNPGDSVAIVGETGSGKTTIISLLSRLYACQRGTIRIGGIDINEIPREVVRNSIGTVMQETFLFSRTVRENVILNRHYTKEVFDRVTQATHIDRFISSLPNGDSEMVMERGATFSAGERQLLAFARALYGDPSILVLDEATSNIDTETEQLIQDAIGNLIRGRTSLIIAHRLSTVRNAAVIVVLDKGRVVETGDHTALLAKNGLYAELCALQFGLTKQA
jgi:ATP-binding cassette subfamily B multidrug efflux pump